MVKEMLAFVWLEYGLFYFVSGVCMSFLWRFQSVSSVSMVLTWYLYDVNYGV